MSATKVRRPQLATLLGSRSFMLAASGLCCAVLTIGESSVVAQHQPSMEIGVHIGYVPGDAFFSVEIDDSASAIFSKPPEMGALELMYKYPPLRAPDMTLPQFHGFDRLLLQDVSDEHAKVLQYFGEVLDRDSAYLNRQVPPRVLIVNRNFDWEQHRFFVRYNEEWPRLDRNRLPEMPVPVEAGIDLLPTYYQPHLNSSDSVIEDWQYGGRVESLAFRFPKTATVKTRNGTRRLAEPITVQMKDIAVVGFPATDPNDAFGRRFVSVRGTHWQFVSEGRGHFSVGAGEIPAG